jgi:hypothetical protein
MLMAIKYDKLGNSEGVQRALQHKVTHPSNAVSVLSLKLYDQNNRVNCSLWGLVPYRSPFISRFTLSTLREERQFLPFALPVLDWF